MKMTKQGLPLAWACAWSLAATGVAAAPQTAPQSGNKAGDQGGSLDERLAPPAPGGLTADQVAARAQETSFDAAARREAIRAAEARLEQATVGYVPKLSLSARYTRLSPIDPIPIGPGASIVFPVDQYLGQATLTVPLTDYVLRTSQNYAAASRNKRAAMLDEQATRLKAAVDGRDAFYTWVKARAQVIVAERSLDQSRAHLEDAKHAFEVGTSSRADVLSVEAQVARAELVLEQAKLLTAVSEDQIRTAMHDPSSQPYAIGEDIRSDPPPLPNIDDVAALRAEAMDRRLEVRALDETAWSFREQAKVSRAGYYPRLDAFGDVIYAKPNPRIFIPTGNFQTTWDVGLQLTWTPNDAFNSSGQTHENEARAAQTEAQKASLRDAVKLEVMTYYKALRESEVAVQTGKRALAAAEEAYRVRRELFRNGRATSVELTDAEVALFNASLDIVNARANVRVARSRLLHALGRDIPAPAPTR